MIPIVVTCDKRRLHRFNCLVQIYTRELIQIDAVAMTTEFNIGMV